MSLGVCIPDLVEQGKIPKAKAKEITRRYEAMVAAREGEMGRVAAEADATAKLVKALETDAAEGARRKALQARNQQTWLAERQAADGPVLSGAAMRRELELTEYRIDTVFSHMLTGFDAFIARHRRNLFGQLRETAELEDVVRARFGETVDSPSAKAVAEAMGETMEYARLRRNRAGGSTAKLDSYGLPQSHDSALVGAVSPETWAARPEIVRAKVRDPDTGEWAEGVRRAEILNATYANIRSEGAESLTPGGNGAGSLARRRQETRVIHFASADDWLSYAKDFGGGTNAYDIFLGHTKAMAREIVLMEDMGPNPAASLRFRQDWLEKSIKTGPDRKLFDGVRGGRASLQRRFDVIAAVANIPDSAKWARRMSAARAWQMSAKLGSAVVSAVPGDTATMLHRAGYNRLPAMQMLKGYAAMTAELGGLADAQAVRLGMVTDEWLGLHSAAWRQGGEELIGEKSRVLADGVIRASGLARHTRLMQWAFSRETMGHLTDQRAVPFDELAGPMRRMFGKYGIDAAGWDKFRATETIEDGGVQWLSPAHAGEIGEKFGVMLRNERDFAVLMPDLRTRAFLQQHKAGSLTGEALRSVLMLKSFPLTMLSRNIPEMLAQRGVWNRAAYAAGLVALTTTGGMLTLWAKDVLNGKDPRALWGEDGVDAGTLAQALFQGGGLGLIGDLIKSAETRTGGGIAGAVAGPLVGAAFDVVDAVVQNASAALDGDDSTDTKWGRDFAKIGLANTPGSSLWYLRLAFDRTLADWLLEQVDPDRGKAIRRQERYAEEQGTQHFARPGGGFPGQRLPDISNIGAAASADPEPGSLIQ